MVQKIWYLIVDVMSLPSICFESCWIPWIVGDLEFCDHEASQMLYINGGARDREYKCCTHLLYLCACCIVSWTSDHQTNCGGIFLSSCSCVTTQVTCSWRDPLILWCRTRRLKMIETLSWFLSHVIYNITQEFKSRLDKILHFIKRNILD